jgi:hypothetical protein
MESTAAFLRDRLRSLIPTFDPMAPAELNQRAREVIENIDAETCTRTAHSQRVARLYAMARDIQHAKEAGAGEMTVYRIVSFLFDVLKRSYLPTMAPR